MWPTASTFRVCLEDGVNFFPNFRAYASDYTVSYPRRFKSQYPLMWEHKFSKTTNSSVFIVSSILADTWLTSASNSNILIAADAIEDLLSLISSPSVFSQASISSMTPIIYAILALIICRLLSRLTLGKLSGSVTKPRISTGSSLGGLSCDKVLEYDLAMFWHVALESAIYCRHNA